MVRATSVRSWIAAAIALGLVPGCAAAAPAATYDRTASLVIALGLVPGCAAAAPAATYDRYPEQPLLAGKSNTGVAFPGGGVRAYSVGLGVVRALRELGLEDAPRYFSMVSGGNWLGNAYLYAESPAGGEDELVGPYTPPQDLDEKALKRDGGLVSGPSNGDSRFIWEMGTCVLGELRSDADLDNCWRSAVVERFVLPFGIGSKALAAWDEAHATELEAAFDRRAEVVRRRGGKVPPYPLTNMALYFAAWIFRGESRRRRGHDVDSPWRRVAAAPRPRRAYSAETGLAAPPRPRRGKSVETSAGRRYGPAAVAEAQAPAYATARYPPLVATPHAAGSTPSKHDVTFTYDDGTTQEAPLGGLVDTWALWGNGDPYALADAMSHASLAYFAGADLPSMNRGGAAAATWIFRGDESRRRRGRDVDIPWEQVAATPRSRDVDISVGTTPRRRRPLSRREPFRYGSATTQLPTNLPKFLERRLLSWADARNAVPELRAGPDPTPFHAGDGGNNGDNAGFGALLQRGVDKILLVLPTMQPLNLTWVPARRPPTETDIDQYLSAYFG